MTEAAAPQTPADAAAALAARLEDQKFVEAVFAGDVTARGEWDELVKAKAEADPIGAALDGTLPVGEFTTTTGGELPPGQILQFVESMRAAGVDDGVIRQVLEGHKVARWEVDAVTRLQKEKMTDQAWVKRLLTGDAVATREFTLMSIVLSSEIEEKSAL